MLRASYNKIVRNSNRGKANKTVNILAKSKNINILSKAKKSTKA